MIMKHGPTLNRVTTAWSIILITAILICSIGIADSAERRRRPMTRRDKCPVCGMFVYKYPKWVAVIEFTDDSAHFYDGAKDMFKHLFNVSKYSPGKSAQDIMHIHVTDYYAVALIDAKKALYVIGSNVLGPMGHELIPFEDEASAKEFLEDHKGTRILRFSDISEETIKALDAAQQ